MTKNSSNTTTTSYKNTIASKFSQTLKIGRKQVIKFYPSVVKYVFYTLSVGGICFITIFIVDRHIVPHKYIIAAGKKNGESYIISKALAKVVNDRSCKKLFALELFRCDDIRVADTQGTEQNIEFLEGTRNKDSTEDSTEDLTKDLKAGYIVGLVTAQADIVTDTIQLSTTKNKNPNSSIKFHARTVAKLYQDYFQLLVSPELNNQLLTAINNAEKQPQNENLKKAEAEKQFYEFIKNLAANKLIIDVPATGGQHTSFLSIAEHFGLKENSKENPKGSFYTNDSSSKNKAPELDKNSPAKKCKPKDHAVFRVRALGNSEVQDCVKEGWKLLPIEQAEAMRHKHPAFQADAKIPVGMYEIGSSKENMIPPIDLNTISVQRLLLARDDIPDWLIYEITLVLNEHRPELAKALQDEIKEELKHAPYPLEYKNVPPLITEISEPSIQGNVGIKPHPGALKFYKPEQSLFDWIMKNNGFITFILTNIPLVFFGMRWINKMILKDRRDTADKYMARVTNLMTDLASDEQVLNHQTNACPSQLNPELAKNLKTWVKQLDNLRKIFKEARESLEHDAISEESFRTINEAYESAREFIEEKIESYQRTISSFYVQQVMSLLDKTKTQNPSLENLSKIRDEAAIILIGNNIFSRESFRTFIEAHNLVRDALR